MLQNVLISLNSENMINGWQLAAVFSMTIPTISPNELLWQKHSNFLNSTALLN